MSSSAIRAPAGAPGIAVLTYHALDEGGSVLSTPPTVFAAQMDRLKSQGVRTLSLAAIAGCLREGQVPDNAVALTFDDGFESVHRHALPVLRRHGFTASVFLVPGFCGRTNDWPGQPASIPRLPLLQWRQVEELATEGIEIGAHTLTHPDLTRLPPARAAEEVTASKKAIEDHVQRPVVSFAYPYGRVNATVRAVACDAFALACGTRLAFARAGGDLYDLDRVDTYYLRDPRVFRRLFSPAMQAYLTARRGLRAVRAALPERDRIAGAEP